MPLRIVRNHGGVKTVITADLTSDLGLTPDGNSYIVDFRVTKTRLYIVVSDMNAVSSTNTDGFRLFYRDLAPWGTWTSVALNDPSYDPPSMNHASMQVLVTEDDRIIALDGWNSEGGVSYRARTIVVNADQSWSVFSVSENLKDWQVYLYFAGPNKTFPVLHSKDWLVGWDPDSQRPYDVRRPPQVASVANGPQGSGFDLWTGVVAFAINDIWAYQGDTNAAWASPETYLGHLIHWNGFTWEDGHRIPVSDSRVDGFVCGQGDMAGRPGGGKIYLKDSPAYPLGGDLWMAIKEVDLVTGEVNNVAQQDLASRQWLFQGGIPNGALPPGMYAAQRQGSWGNGNEIPRGSTQAFADGSLLMGFPTQPYI